MPYEGASEGGTRWPQPQCCPRHGRDGRTGDLDIYCPMQSRFWRALRTRDRKRFFPRRAFFFEPHWAPRTRAYWCVRRGRGGTGIGWKRKTVWSPGSRVLAEQLQPNVTRPSDQVTFVVAPVGGSSVAVADRDRRETRDSPQGAPESLQSAPSGIGSCESRHGNPDKLEAIKVFQTSRKPHPEKRRSERGLHSDHPRSQGRLSADICGVMLKEDDWLVMQRCVGNLASETASLRMRAGQGVGRTSVEPREPCAIEDYVHSEIISRDFFGLARAERVKSALAVPLLSQNEVTAALEVWRRRPSRFTPQHTAELATLANLASLAIENVRLAQARESAARRLESPTRSFKRDTTSSACLRTPEGLRGLLLSGCALSEIAEQASHHLSRPVMHPQSAA